MISSFVIVFREILEAALVIGVVAAAVKGLAHRGRWVSVGVGLGIAGAALIAAGIGIIARFAHGNGQEIFEAGVLFAAGLMLAWHNIYMAHHGRELTQKLRTMGTAVLAGSASLVMLIGVTALAVMREGSEIALFLTVLLPATAVTGTCSAAA
jgi:high-affinity iron transporter